MGSKIELLFATEKYSPDLIFVEAEDGSGRSLKFGEWSERGRYRVLSFQEPESMYQGGYQDGIGDAYNTVERLLGDATEGAVFDCLRELKILQGWRLCCACDGTGKNMNPTMTDLKWAIVESLSVSGRNSTQCKTCHGYGATPTKEQTND